MKKWPYSKIAKLAGVSEPTVSRVVNGISGVCPEKQEKVNAVLRTIDFRKKTAKPNARKYKIGILLTGGSDWYASSCCRKLMALCAGLPANGSLVLIRSGITSYELISMHLRHEIDGLLIIGFSIPPDLFYALTEQIPHVWLNSHNGDSGESVEILSGNELGGRMAARYLIGKSCHSVAFFSIPSINPGFQARIDGFRFEFFSRNLLCSELPMAPDGGTLEKLTDWELELMMGKCFPIHFFQKYDGLFFPEERLAALYYRYRHRLGTDSTLPVCVACGNTKGLLTGIYPRPAVIDLGPEIVAEQGMRRLISMLKGKSNEEAETIVLVTPKLIAGEPDSDSSKSARL